jgi:cell division protein FtsB
VAGSDVEGNTQVSRLPRLSLTPLLLAAAALTIGYFVLTTARNVYHNHQLAQEEAAIRRDIAQLDRDHAQLIAVRDYLKSDEYIEYNARRVLGLVKPGETLVVVSNSAPAPIATATPPLTTAEGGAWWKELFAPAIAPTATP